ncbi:hypothetical protein [Niallia sp. NCCP-28]|uniref:hypothetical protein n=1 Tax=Niallia sp. NCCP-28 TaxID=2934712 RepID=UPI00208B2805|nr:hypothetical protein [Niallia sp. NCCP-28]GKU80630.1 hypothetical protein NCCP28_00260 [Niallia sp. NCCP-28]
MKLYKKPLKAFLTNDLHAFESAENDKHLIYHFKKGYVTVLGEFDGETYEGGTACIIFNGNDVIAVAKGLLRFMDSGK